MCLDHGKTKRIKVEIKIPQSKGKKSDANTNIFPEQHFILPRSFEIATIPKKLILFSSMNKAFLARGGSL